MKRKRWVKGEVQPRFGTDTDRLFTPDYPVWIGADRKLSESPLPVPGRPQVSGHIMIPAPEASPVRIRIDTSGGVREPLTGCLLRGPGAHGALGSIRDSSGAHIEQAPAQWPRVPPPPP